MKIKIIGLNDTYDCFEVMDLSNYESSLIRYDSLPDNCIDDELEIDESEIFVFDVKYLIEL